MHIVASSAQANFCFSDDEEFRVLEQQGRPFAVVTVGFDGISLELAREFASDRHHVPIAAEDTVRLMQATWDLSGGGAMVRRSAADGSVS